MTYRGIAYFVVHSAHPAGWRWTVEFTPRRAKTGIAPSKEAAFVRAFFAIDQSCDAAEPEWSPRRFAPLRSMDELSAAR